MPTAEEKKRSSGYVVGEEVWETWVGKHKERQEGRRHR